MASESSELEMSAPWEVNVRHRADPNRVSSLQIPTPGRFEPSPPGGESYRGDRVIHTGEVRRTHALPQLSRSLAEEREHSYYDVPLLQEPVWKWQIANYFYLGGLSAGAYLIARVAECIGGPKHRELSRLGAYLALAAIIPCPPLLIADLGDPKRFHHMLRVWKPSTPMNLGTWSIVAYSSISAVEVLRQYLSQSNRRYSPEQQSRMLKLMNSRPLLLLHDALGIPFALVIAGYTGVLLTCTSNPLWCKNPFLGPLFSASALSTGAEALSLLLDLVSKNDTSASQKALVNLDTAAHAAELASLAGFSHFAGERSRAMSEGPMKKHHLFSIGAILAAEVLKRLPVEPRYKKPLRMAAAILGLTGSFSMRWAVVFGGHHAAADPHLSRSISQPGALPQKDSHPVTAPVASPQEPQAIRPVAASPHPPRSGTPLPSDAINPA